MNSTQIFINKYKPYTIEEFCCNSNSDMSLEDQEYNVKEIINILFEIDDLNMIIVGNIGSGKTTILTTIIRKYYGFTNTQNIPETNIMFINSLKEQGIQFYRNEMKTFCQTHCSIYGKKKMVVIDDIDMINEQSQQVFRNYIDKYKRNVHFITTCSNIQKVIESIQSRIHIIRIYPPTKPQVEHIMNTIITKENIQITEDAKMYLLTFCQHSVRTLISNLEKMYILNEAINLDICCALYSDISFTEFEKYIAFLKTKELHSAIIILDNIYEFGYSVIDILDYFFTFVKSTQILSEDEKYQITKVICKQITVFYNIHEDSIELSIISKKIMDILVT